MIGRDELCSLIPHSYDMCLLDRVDYWDDKKIICYSKSHLSDTHPLERNHHLSSVHLLEYGAQAMAVHGGLHNRQNGIQMTEGYLAALRDVKLNLCDLRKSKSELRIEANQILSQEGNMIYSFNVTVDDNEIASGRATVVAVAYNKQ